MALEIPRPVEDFEPPGCGKVGLKHTGYKAEGFSVRLRYNSAKNWRAGEIHAGVSEDTPLALCACIMQIGHFRVPLNLSFKESLRAKLLLW